MKHEVSQLEQRTARTYDMLVNYLAGERRDEEEIYARLRKRVLLITRARLRPWLRLRETSEDIAQESLLGLWNYLSEATFDHPAKLAAYLSVVVQRVIVGRARYHEIEVRNPAHVVPIERSRGHMSSELFQLELDGGESDPVSQMLRKEDGARLSEALMECLDELPEHYREIMSLRVLYGFSSSESARVLGREADGAFSMLTSRARASLADRMSRRGFGFDASA